MLVLEKNSILVTVASRSVASARSVRLLGRKISAPLVGLVRLTVRRVSTEMATSDDVDAPPRPSMARTVSV